MSNPVMPGGINIIGHPDKEANRERKASLLRDQPDEFDKEHKDFVFDRPLTLTDYYIVEVLLLISGLVLLVIIVAWTCCSDMKWNSENYGSSHYEEFYD